MVQCFDTNDICCAALELSQSKWLCAVAAPETDAPSIQTFKAGEVDRLVAWLGKILMRHEAILKRPLEIVLCYEAGYDGFWLARLLPTKGIRTIVFDPTSFLKPRRGRLAKTDRLDAEGMTRTLRAWMSGDRSVARDVRIPTVEEEDAKRIERERKNLVEERTRIVGRIKGLLALHGIRLDSKGIGKSLRGRLDTLETGDGRPLPPFLRHEIGRLLDRHEFVCDLMKKVEADRKRTLASDDTKFPCREKVKRLANLGAVGETTATVLVAEVFHRTFETRRHLASFLGLAPSPHASGDVSRDRGINKAGAKFARQTLVELAWFWLRYQPRSKLSLWWHERFAGTGMRGRKVGIVALARKLAIALWHFVEHGVVPEGATLKA